MVARAVYLSVRMPKRKKAAMSSGQVIATSHDLTPVQMVAEEGKSPYFREIQVGEILLFGQNHGAV